MGRDRGLLRVAWRHLLKNHPHDSICGCSVDQVHQEMETRFDWSEQVAEVVASRSLTALAQETDSASLLGPAGQSGAIALFNSEAGPRTDWVATTAQLPADPPDLVLADAAGNTMPFQLLRRERQEIASSSLSRQEVQGYLRLSGPGKDWPRWKLRILEKVIRAALRGTAPDLVIARMEVVPGADPTTVDLEVEASSGGEHNYDSVSMAMRHLNALVDRGDVQFFRVRAWRGDQAEIGFVARDVPAYGVKLFHFQRATPARHAPMDEHEWPTLENEYLSIQVSPEDGTGHLLDRESGAIYWGINGFLDEGDAGDEYTFSPPQRDWTSRGRQRPHGSPGRTGGRPASGCGWRWCCRCPRVSRRTGGGAPASWWIATSPPGYRCTRGSPGWTSAPRWSTGPGTTGFGCSSPPGSRLRQPTPMATSPCCAAPWRLSRTSRAGWSIPPAAATWGSSWTSPMGCPG